MKNVNKVIYSCGTHAIWKCGDIFKVIDNTGTVVSTNSTRGDALDWLRVNVFNQKGA